MKPIKIHTAQPKTHLPAHERAARRGRAAIDLPNFLTARKPSTRPAPTGRKTTYDYPSLPSTQHPHHTNP